MSGNDAAVTTAKKAYSEFRKWEDDVDNANETTCIQLIGRVATIIRETMSPAAICDCGDHISMSGSMCRNCVEDCLKRIPELPSRDTAKLAKEIWTRLNGVICSGVKRDTVAEQAAIAAIIRSTITPPELPWKGPFEVLPNISCDKWLIVDGINTVVYRFGWKQQDKATALCAALNWIHDQRKGADDDAG